MIFVDVVDTQIRVTGETYGLRKILGQSGLGFQFNKDKKAWKGNVSLKALHTLADISGAVLTSAATDEMARFQRAAEKRAAYMARKVEA